MRFTLSFVAFRLDFQNVNASKAPGEPAAFAPPSPPAAEHPPADHHHAPKRATWPLVLGALGVVYGDIGTSPLYALRECLKAVPDADPHVAVLGSLSLIFWTLVVVVCVKYLCYVTHADNRGEGGIFALLALTHRRSDRLSVGFFVMLVLAGAALLYGDGLITPAISVLSAAEGLKSLSPHLAPVVPWVAAGILLALFITQKHGTARIGGVFGPIMLIWFATLGLLGVASIVRHPAVLEALLPFHGIRFLWTAPGHGAVILGAVVLSVTGAEALYADMGHFGRPAIVRGWYGVAFPGLLLNYFGQGALVLADPSARTDPFFRLAGGGILGALLVVLSFAATVIASQALITGSFSLTRQAVQLGYFPRVHVSHTNAEHEGQIYLPLVNWALAVGSITLVLGFGSSERLAAAYGIAVTGTMAVTTVAFYAVVRRCWNWSRPRALAFCIPLLSIDIVFFLANIHKVHEGGWVPLAVGAVLLIIMHTWKIGRANIVRELARKEIALPDLIADINANGIHRNPGTAVFMAGRPEGVPVVLLHHLRCNMCLHETVIILSIKTDEVPLVDAEDRIELEGLGSGFWRAVAHYGYMENPSAVDAVEALRARGVPIRKTPTFFFNREIVVPTGKARMPRWQKRFYGLLSRNAVPARDHYQIPPNQIVELGLPIRL
jgi:KUP system potassium uptake protein